MTVEQGRGLAVLTYHGFSSKRTVTTTTASWFAETLAALAEAGFHGVDLDAWVARGRPDEPRGFALTFDDGLRSILDVAEVVASHRIPATVFLPVDHVGKDNEWPGQPGWVERERLIDWSEARALAALGFRFGAHGRTHVPLDRLDVPTLESELIGSHACLEDRLGRACTLLAYPYGIASRRVRREASRHYAAAFGTRLDYATSRQDPFNLSRLDAYYLDARPALEALVRDSWRGWLRGRRAMRTARRFVAGRAA